MLRRGKSYAGERVVLYLAPGEGETRAAFLAGRRVGGAVERNRARRLLREAWKAARPRLRGGHLLVLAARSSIEGAKVQDVWGDVVDLLVRAGAVKR